jgi:hypothetical protein
MAKFKGIFEVEDDEILDYVKKTMEYEIIEYIRTNIPPEEVFNKAALENWAEDNGYTKGEK